MMKFKDYVCFLGKSAISNIITLTYYLPRKAVNTMNRIQDHININRPIPAKPVDTDIALNLIEDCISMCNMVRSKSKGWTVSKATILKDLSRLKLITSGLLGYIKALEENH